MRIFLALLVLFLPQLVLSGHPLLKGSDQEAKSLIDAVTRFPGGYELVNLATKEGPITVRMQRDSRMPFEAMWQSGPRVITLDGVKKTSRGERIRDLIFELHNAVTTEEDAVFGRLAREGKISCDQFVMEVEKIEHNNVKRTASLVEDGIRARIYPSDARWKIVHDFNLHYKIQQLSGHSDAIAEEYRHISPRSSSYKGTIAGLKTRSHSENIKRAADLYWNYLNS